MYVAAHRGEWSRLEQLLRRGSSPRKLSGAEVDELVELYQRTATHLSFVQSTGRDEALVGRLSSLVARGRGVVAGGRKASWSDAARFLKVDFPAICYRTRWWWIGSTAFFLVIAFGVGGFIAASPEAQLAVAPPDVVKQLVEEDFENYYSSAPAQDFAAQVFTNNAFIAAQSIVFGVLLGIPVLFVLVSNAVNVGIAGGLMAANDRTGLFFGLILPHGLLELTAVIVAGAAGLRLGWALIAPGDRTRATAVAEEGRRSVAIVLGLILVFVVAGLIEGYVTPSPLPTAVRVGIGVAVEVLFLTWVIGYGRRAEALGLTGALGEEPRAEPAAPARASSQ